MSASLKHCVRVFWAWQEDQEAEWLQRMALDGWSLKSIRGVRYTFERTAAKRMLYRLDFKVVPNEELAEYLQLYQDAGWEYVTRFGNWFYFRRPADTTAQTELYTDNASRLARYRSQLRVMILAGLPLLLLGGAVYPLLIRSYEGWGIRLLYVFILLSAALYAGAVGRIVQIIRRLERDPKE